MRRFSSPLAMLAVAALMPITAAWAQPTDEAARLVDALTRKGYLASIEAAAERSAIRATVGPKMQFIRAEESLREICMQLLSSARATNREVFRAELVDEGGQRIVGCRLGPTP